jgi:hypothetical protein
MGVNLAAIGPNAITENASVCRTEARKGKIRTRRDAACR